MVKSQSILVIIGFFACLAAGVVLTAPMRTHAQDSPPATTPAETVPETVEPTAKPPPGAPATEGESGPTILMPPGEVAPKEPEAGEYGVQIDPLRGMQQGRFDRAAKTSVGGYGELHLNLIKPEGEVAAGRLDLHRFVLLIAHNFNDRFRFYSELELEHAFVADSDGVAIPGSFQVEQAFIDWRILKGDSEHQAGPTEGQDLLQEK